MAMARIEKVDLLLAAVKAEQSGDLANRKRIEDIIRNSIDNEKRENTYCEIVYVQRDDKKAASRNLVKSF